MLPPMSTAIGLQRGFQSMIQFKRLFLVGVAAVFTVSARAESVKAHFDTYFYDAPRSTARVLDEVQDKAPLTVLSCDNLWCRVRYGEAEGYVREIVVHGPENDVFPDGHNNRSNCFKASQPGGVAWQTEKFCQLEK